MNLKKESLKRGPGFPVSKHCNKISRNLVLDQQYMFPGNLVGWKQDPTRDYMHVIPSTSLGISPGVAGPCRTGSVCFHILPVLEWLWKSLLYNMKTVCEVCGWTLWGFLWNYFLFSLMIHILSLPLDKYLITGSFVSTCGKSENPTTASSRCQLEPSWHSKQKFHLYSFRRNSPLAF